MLFFLAFMNCDEASNIQKGNKPFNIFQGAEQSQGIEEKKIISYSKWL
jgi:hypothetical protein